MSDGTFDLDRIRVASPCAADWNAMQGDERVRHCGQCRLNVYDLSGMTRDEAIDLVRRSEGRTCVRFRRRRDGRILTRDCPPGRRRVRRRRGLVAAALGALAASVLGSVLLEQARPREHVMGGIMPIELRAGDADPAG